MNYRLWLVMGIFFFQVPGYGEEFFLATDGRDSNPGTESEPFASLERAREAIRQVKADRGMPVGGVTVRLKEGTYTITKTFELGPEDSGTKESPIVYRACTGAKVSLMGGRPISPSAFAPVSDSGVAARLSSDEARCKVLQVDVRALGISHYGKMSARGFRRPYVNPGLELFFNDEAMEPARWPNEGRVAIGEVVDPGSAPRFGDYANRGGTFKYDVDRPARWRKSEDIWVSGIFNKPWADDTLRIANIDTGKKTITVDGATMYGIESSGEKSWGQEARGYFFLNVLEEIDRPGEWYLDREKGILYFWPPGPMAEAKVAVSLLDEPMAAMEDVSYVTFRDLTWEVTRGIGIYIEGGESNLIAGCTLRNIGVVAVCVGRGVAPDSMLRHNFTGEPISRQLGSWHEHIYDNPAFDRRAGQNHGIVSCDIYNIGAGGISLGGGDRKTLTVGHNRVVNCDIHDYNRLDRSYKAAVNIDGVGNTIAHNLIHRAPASAVYLHGNDHVMEYNEICDVVNGATEDMGAFYMGRDPSERGNVIRYNFWHHIGDVRKMINVIYLDDGASGTLVKGNVFYKAGSAMMGVVMLNGGWDNRVVNNVFVECPTAMCASARWQGGNREELTRYIEAGGLWRVRLEESIRHDSDPYRQRYPELAGFFANDLTQPSGNYLSGNVFCKLETILRSHQSPKVIQENNFETGDDALFVEAAKMDFHIKEGSLVDREISDFQTIPFAEIGLRKDDFRAIVPTGISRSNSRIAQ